MNLVKFKPTQNHKLLMGNINPFNQFMSDFFSDSGFSNNSVPAVNLIDSGDEFVIELAAPGYKKEDFDIKIENQELTISGKKENQESKEEMYYINSEFNYSDFTRKFRIGKNIDPEKIEANYENGILLVKLAKKEEAKLKPPRNIQIN